MSGPTLAGYVSFLRAAGFNTTVLPDNSPFIPLSYNLSVETANCYFSLVSTTIYEQMVYCLATSLLIANAPDQVGQTFFADMRKKWNIGNFVAGVATSASDQGTAVGLAVSDALSNLTIMDLENLKDPWGRQYLAWAQNFGTVWGLT